jgi:hypothetical protein
LQVLEFRLHSEGSNKRPQWGIAFRHRADVPKVFDTDRDKRPVSIRVRFPDSKVYTFGIRPSFWNGCYELVDSQVHEGTRPVKDFALDRLRYSVKTKGRCVIEAQVVKRNGLLNITKFR